MDWTEMGAKPPISTSPTCMMRVFLRLIKEDIPTVLPVGALFYLNRNGCAFCGLEILGVFFCPEPECVYQGFLNFYTVIFV
jgi:hypothetical protein